MKTRKAGHLDNLEIQVEQHPAGPVVRFKGDAGVGMGRNIDLEMTRLCATRPALVVIDLSQLDMISSLVMGQFIATQRALARFGGKVRLAGTRPLVMDSFRRAGLDHIFEFFATAEDALAA